MPGKVPSARTKLYVCATPYTTATDTESEYEALTWVEVGEVTNFGAFGATFQEVTHTPVGTAVVERLKGAKDNGQLQLTLARVPADAGQVVLKTALDNYASYPFYVALNDNPGGVGDKPTRFYFPALVMSYTVEVGDANSVVTSTVTLGIDGNILEAARVDAT